MAQYDFGTIDPNTKSGTALASDLNSWRNALHSTHSGSSAPSYTTAAMLWADTTSSDYELKMYDGAQWITVAILDATNNVARVAIDSAETSYITSTTAGQIRHVIASSDVFTTLSTGIQFNIASPVISDSNNNELISFTTTASAVNQLNIANGATGSGPTLSAVGGDTDMDIMIAPKGAGVVYALAETAATNTVIDVARLESRSTGTPAAGIGSGLLFSVETAASNLEIGARIEAITTDVTATSEDFDLAFKVMAGGAAATEVMRVRSNKRVGINTSTPSTSLHVVDATDVMVLAESIPSGGIASLKARGHQSAAVIVSNINQAGGIGALGSVNEFYVFSESGYPIDFRVESASLSAMHISTAAYVGINNQAPIVPLHITGASATTGVIYRNQGAQTVETAAATLTIAELLTGIIQYTGAAATLTLPTGTNMQNGLPASFPTNMSFDFSVVNTGTGTATLGTATGLTLTGSMAVTTANSALFRARRTGTNTFTIYRIA